MKLHEYQAKQLLAKAGVKVLTGVVVDRAEDIPASFAPFINTTFLKKAVSVP